MTELSDLDREFLLHRIYSELSQRYAETPTVLLTQTSNEMSHSSHFFFNEIASELSNNPILVNSLRSNQRINSSILLEKMKTENPFEYIHEVLTMHHDTLVIDRQYSSNNTDSSLPTESMLCSNRPIILMIFIPFLEKLPNDLLQNTIRSMKDKLDQNQDHQQQEELSNYKIVFFVTTNLISSSRMLWDEYIEFAVDYYHLNRVITSYQLFDQIFYELILKNKLPFMMSSDVIDVLNEEFYQFTMCSSTYLQR